MAVFGTDIEMSPYDSKRVPKWRYSVENFLKIYWKQKIILIGQINGSKLCFVLCLMSAVKLFGVKNLMCSYESPWNEDAKIGIGSVSSSNTSRENEQNAFPELPWIHWCEPNCRYYQNTYLRKIFGTFFKE